MTVFKIIAEAVVAVATHPVTREIVAVAITVVAKEVAKKVK